MLSWQVQIGRAYNTWRQNAEFGIFLNEYRRAAVSRGSFVEKLILPLVLLIVGSAFTYCSSNTERDATSRILQNKQAFEKSKLKLEVVNDQHQTQKLRALHILHEVTDQEYEDLLAVISETETPAGPAPQVTGSPAAVESKCMPFPRRSAGPIGAQALYSTPGR